jgi:hypothetical protein
MAEQSLGQMKSLQHCRGTRFAPAASPKRLGQPKGLDMTNQDKQHSAKNEQHASADGNKAGKSDQQQQSGGKNDQHGSADASKVGNNDQHQQSGGKQDQHGSAEAKKAGKNDQHGSKSGSR